jgi:Family of unknown function (DUF6275)
MRIMTSLDISPETLAKMKTIAKTNVVPAEDPGPDRFIIQARNLVAENFNAHRDVTRSTELSPDEVYVVWFSKTLMYWKAACVSPTIRGMMWEVTFNAHRKEAYIDVFKKIGNAKVPLADVEEPSK